MATCAHIGDGPYGANGDCKLSGQVFHKTGTITNGEAQPLQLGGVGVDVLGVEVEVLVGVLVLGMGV